MIPILVKESLSTKKIKMFGKKVSQYLKNGPIFKIIYKDFFDFWRKFGLAYKNGHDNFWVFLILILIVNLKPLYGSILQH